MARAPRLLFLSVLTSACALAQWDDGLLKPFVMNPRAAGASPADLTFLHDAPAGKDGFVRVRNGHLVA